MYKKIVFNTESYDSNGYLRYKPLTYCIAEFLKTLKFDNFEILLKSDFTAICVYFTPILQQASWFSSQKNGEPEHITTLLYDIETEKIIYFKKYDDHAENEVSIPELLFSCLRPDDYIEIRMPEKNSEGVSVIGVYRGKKQFLEKFGIIEAVEYYGNMRKIPKTCFIRTEKIIPKKKGRRNGRKNTVRKRNQI